MDISDEDITRAAEDVRDEMVVLVSRAADKLLGRPEIGTPEWVEQRSVPDEQRHADLREWYLTKLRIELALAHRAVPVGTGCVVNARQCGATWEQIGAAAGMTADAAEEQWEALCES